ncbi:DUF5701 family protein [Brachybacterium saurashtrense]|uniref:DUF5701 family protein n=1 Tax=Brachybacterium saurashtrense TaxID=556288 RepID=UPI001F494016|nr:DUF5701 family protein [Brachybacterium saurashtrense]
MARRPRAPTPSRGAVITATVALPSLAAQAERLIALEIHTLAGLPAEALREAAVRAGADRTDALLAVDPALARPSALAPLMRRGEKPGFVVEDMTDVDAFAPTGVDLSDCPLYLVVAPDRGDEHENASPAEALTAITAAGRSPLLLTEGLLWVLQVPEVLERNHCFMTIGSRTRTASGRLDSRTPALWISGGTGRDGTERKDAPKLGWCWWNNRHTWLGIASAGGRAEG